jgi:hypothetical protein
MSRVQRALRRAAGAPLLHFVLIGGALFAFVAGRRPPARVGEVPTARQPVVITAAQVEQLRDDYARETGRAPSREEEAALIDRAVEEELLYRAALARGLDRGDRSIRWRLTEKMRFLGEGAEGEGEQLYRRALDLGLDRDDAIIRRILVEKMRLLASLEVGAEEPSEAELQDYLDRHRDRYVEPARVSFWHVFLSTERRGARLEPAARELRADLERRPTAPARAVERGDTFALGAHVQAASAQQVAKLFGSGFAGEVLQLEVGRWSQPIQSAYGLHLVWVEAREPARTVPLDAVRTQVLRALSAERRAARVADLLERLRRQYEVRVDVAEPTARGDG